ncbi:unnamed protein product, partial [Brassica oleracea]
GSPEIRYERSTWVVSILFASIILLRRDGTALWGIIGSVSNSALSVVLKRILNQARPATTSRPDPEMPSTHAQSISFIFVFAVLSGTARHFQRLDKKLLHIVGYNKNDESESVKQDGELMNASEIGATNGEEVEEFQSQTKDQGKQEMSGKQRVEKSEEEDGRGEELRRDNIQVNYS